MLSRQAKEVLLSPALSTTSELSTSSFSSLSSTDSDPLDTPPSSPEFLLIPIPKIVVTQYDHRPRPPSGAIGRQVPGEGRSNVLGLSPNYQRRVVAPGSPKPSHTQIVGIPHLKRFETDPPPAPRLKTIPLPTISEEITPSPAFAPATPPGLFLLPAAARSLPDLSAAADWTHSSPDTTPFVVEGDDDGPLPIDAFAPPPTPRLGSSACFAPPPPPPVPKPKRHKDDFPVPPPNPGARLLSALCLCFPPASPTLTLPPPSARLPRLLVALDLASPSPVFPVAQTSPPAQRIRTKSKRPEGRFLVLSEAQGVVAYLPKRHWKGVRPFMVFRDGQCEERCVWLFCEERVKRRHWVGREGGGGRESGLRWEVGSKGGWDVDEVGVAL